MTLLATPGARHGAVRRGRHDQAVVARGRGPLRALGITPVMLTGDNQADRQRRGHEAGIDQARGNLLPEDKLAEIGAFSRDRSTAMTGDGINDAPALAQADIGFAMGRQARTPMETADVVVMNDDLRRIAETVSCPAPRMRCCGRTSRSRSASRWSSWCWPSLATPRCGWPSSRTHGASLLVVLNGLRLLGKSRESDEHVPTRHETRKAKIK